MKRKIRNIDKAKAKISNKIIVVEGIFQLHPKGFGFIVPIDKNIPSDVLVPRGRTRFALSGDRVSATARARGTRRGKPRLIGEITAIIERGRTDFIGTLAREGKRWVVHPDGRQFHEPIVLAEAPNVPNPETGVKVVARITQYPEGGNPPIGLVEEILGPRGDLRSETLGIQRIHGLEEEFPSSTLKEAARLAKAFRKNIEQNHYSSTREDLTEKLIITIDPATAKDFDDAISLDGTSDGGFELGVHIADVAHFVAENGALDKEAFSRGTSVYFERKVIPMLPEILSNGVCSLVPGEPRLTKSVFITYDANATVTETRLCESVISSKARLTYSEAQDICDGTDGGLPGPVVELVKRMKILAQNIEKRRIAEGMIQLDLPEIELIFENDSRVKGARPKRSAYSHRIIEMFMVETNEAVCNLLDKNEIPHLSRSHPKPSEDNLVQLRSFVRALGYSVSNQPTRKDIQALLKEGENRPEFHALNLAVLKSQSQAEYSSTSSSHYALASEHYCHFTSPIRRYPDLEVHRHVASYCQGKQEVTNKQTLQKLADAAKHCSERERIAQVAEQQLRQILILHFLAQQIGEEFDGIIMGIADQGLFVQHPRFLVEGLIRFSDMGDERWDPSTQYGTARSQKTGTIHRLGDSIPVRISGVNVEKRHLDLVPFQTYYDG